MGITQEELTRLPKDRDWVSCTFLCDPARVQELEGLLLNCGLTSVPNETRERRFSNNQHYWVYFKGSQYKGGSNYRTFAQAATAAGFPLTSIDFRNTFYIRQDVNEDNFEIR